MIVHDFHIVRVALAPAKADAPLVVDPDAVLALAITFQRFQSVCRGNPQVFERRRAVEHAQLAARHILNIRRQASGLRSRPDQLGFLVGKASDHELTITPFVI